MGRGRMAVRGRAGRLPDVPLEAGSGDGAVPQRSVTLVYGDWVGSCGPADSGLSYDEYICYSLSLAARQVGRLFQGR
jgi:hypothetical protein